MQLKVNQISAMQNSEKFLKYLFASSQIYSFTKRLLAGQAVLSVLVPPILSLFALIFSGFKVWAAVYGIVLSYINISMVNGYLNRGKKDAAKIQEAFDCELLEISWNDLKAGDRPEPEQIALSAEQYLKNKPDTSNQQNWYSTSVGRLPIHLARVVCQRSNLAWDMELRKSYITYLRIMNNALFVLLLVAFIVLKVDVNLFVLAILAPMLPVFLWLTGEMIKQKYSVELLGRLLKYVRKLWNQSLETPFDEVTLTEKSRALQDEIFLHRATNQPIFNWIYNALKKKKVMEYQMNVGASALVEEALKAMEDRTHGSEKEV